MEEGAYKGYGSQTQGNHNAALVASTVLGAKDTSGSKRQSLPSWYTRGEGDGKEHRNEYTI